MNLRSQLLFATVLTVGLPAAAFAQATPAAGNTPPDDTPSVRVGATIYADYTYQQSPETTDADGNTINPSSFNVSRSYININGQISHIVAFRITPDIVRESALLTLGSPSVISNDSLVFRLKYAFAQFNLDDWMTPGSWARIGIQQTPFVDYSENIYRYRFQGTTFTEREGFYSSSDAGASFHYNFPSNYGDVHVGIYDGDGYARTDPNDQKAFEIRGTVRPFAKNLPKLRGLRLTGFWFADNYIKNAERSRTVEQVTYESNYVNASFEAIQANDQPSITSPDLEASGWSWWATPRKPLARGSSLEALLRYDHLQSDDRISANRTRSIIGIAYWFPHQGNVSSTIMLDYDGQTFHDYATPQSSIKRIALHAQINF